MPLSEKFVDDIIGQGVYVGAESGKCYRQVAKLQSTIYDKNGGITFHVIGSLSLDEMTKQPL